MTLQTSRAHSWSCMTSLMCGARSAETICRPLRHSSSIAAPSATKAYSRRSVNAADAGWQNERGGIMCGIAGILGRFDREGRDLERMLEAIRHRGPDGEGVHPDAHVTLGHRRLSIIDLAG